MTDKFPPELMSDPLPPKPAEIEIDVEKLTVWRLSLEKQRQSFVDAGWDLSLLDDKTWLLERTVKNLNQLKRML